MDKHKLLVIAPIEAFRHPEKFGGGYVRYKIISQYLGKYVNILEVGFSTKTCVFLNIAFIILKKLPEIRRFRPMAIITVNPSPADTLMGYILSKILRIVHVIFVNAVPLSGYPGYKCMNLEDPTSIPQLWRLLRSSGKSLPVAAMEAVNFYLFFKCLRKAVLIPLTPEVAQSLQRLKYLYVPLTVGIGCIECGSQKNAETEAWDALYVASPVHPDKGLHDLIEAWRLVVKELPNAKLLIAGREDPSFKINLLEDYVNRENLVKNIKIFVCKYGIPHKFIFHLMCQAKLFLYPSLKDQTPLVISEALSCGTPVITYDLPGIRYAYGNCPAVIRVRIGDKHSAAAEVLKLLKNQEDRERMREAALTWCRKKSWEKIALKTLSLYYLATLSGYRARKLRRFHA